MNPFSEWEEQVNRVTDCLRQANENATEMRQLLIETQDKIMRTDENREWLERRNRLLGWPPLEDYSPPVHLKDLQGIAPNATGEKSAVDFVRQQRDAWDEDSMAGN